MQNLKTRGSDGRKDTRRRYRRNIIPHKCTKNFYFYVVFHKIAYQRGVSIMRACGSRPPRRSVKNRKRLRKRTFDCFKSAVRHPILRRRKADPEIVSPRRFFGYLLSEQKVTYITIMEDCDSQSRAGRSLCPAEARYSLIAHSRGPRRLRPENAPRHSTFFVRQDKK